MGNLPYSMADRRVGMSPVFLELTQGAAPGVHRKQQGCEAVASVVHGVAVIMHVALQGMMIAVMLACC